MKPLGNKYRDHFAELTSRGAQLQAAGSGAINGYIPDTSAAETWAAQAVNAVDLVFGPTSPHSKRIHTHVDEKLIQTADQAERVLGVLLAAQRDLEAGFVGRQEMLIAGAVFDSLLDEAKHLLKANHAQCAAILGRIVLEDALRRLAQEGGEDPTGTASAVNDRLKAAGRFAQPKWRMVQSWLDTGNAAAHGQVDDYDHAGVAASLDGIGQFVALELG